MADATISLEDRQAIYDTLARYVWSMDTGDIEAIVTTFTPDGVGQGCHRLKALVKAGFVLPSCRPVPQVWRIADPDQVFEAITEGTVRAAATLRAQCPSAREAIRAALRDTVTAHKRGEYFEIPMLAVLAAAVKP